jgi:hypothetical protein
MEDVLGAGEDGAIDDVEACGQLDLAPSCRGHQRHCIRPLLHGAVGCVRRHRRVSASPVHWCGTAGRGAGGDEATAMRAACGSGARAEPTQRPPAPRPPSPPPPPACRRRRLHLPSLRHSCDSEKVTLLSNFTSIRYQQPCKERNVKQYLRISMKFERKKRRSLISL